MDKILGIIIPKQHSIIEVVYCFYFVQAHYPNVTLIWSSIIIQNVFYTGELEKIQCIELALQDYM